MSSKPGPRPGPGAASGAASGAGGITLDQAKFPSLPTQKALLLIDFQNDFVTKDGAVSVSSVDDALVGRAAKLAAGFRDVGIVIWVQSQFERPRRFIEGQQIITSASQAPTPDAKDEKPVPDPEAFLSSKSPTCVQRGTHGWQLAPPLKKIVDLRRDVVLMKTHYSAFEATRLIQILRSKLVTSLYICGSLINVGVHATAVDAAAHGYAITLVRDCCGRSSQARADAAIANLTDVGGCAVIRARTIVPAIGAEEDGAGRAVISEIDTAKIEADDADDGEDAEDAMDESGLNVLKELKKKYARPRAAPRVRVAGAGTGEEGSGKAGEKKAGERTQRETRAPARQRSERSAKEQKPADKTKELEEGMDKLSLSSESKKGDPATPGDPPAEKLAKKTKEVGERSSKAVSSNVEKPGPRRDQSTVKRAGDAKEAGERSDKAAPSNVEKPGSTRNQSVDKPADKTKNAGKRSDKASSSSNVKEPGPRKDESAEKLAGDATEAEEGSDKASSSNVKEPGPRKDEPAEKPAGDAKEAREGSDKASSSNVEKPGSTRDEPADKPADDTKELQEGLDKLSLSSSDKKPVSSEDSKAEKPTEKASDLQESMDKLSLSESKGSAQSANRPVADRELKPTDP